ncbi:hypothetical protein Tco_1239701, partial [Tanacetum coccineum]
KRHHPLRLNVPDENKVYPELTLRHNSSQHLASQSLVGREAAIKRRLELSNGAAMTEQVESGRRRRTESQVREGRRGEDGQFREGEKDNEETQRGSSVMWRAKEVRRRVEKEEEEMKERRRSTGREMGGWEIRARELEWWQRERVNVKGKECSFCFWQERNQRKKGEGKKRAKTQGSEGAKLNKRGEGSGNVVGSGGARNKGDEQKEDRAKRET